MEKNRIARQLLHMFIGIVVILGLIFVSKPLSLYILFVVFLISVLLSILSRKIKVPLLHFFITHVERAEDEKMFPGKGLIFFLAGCLLTAKLFTPDIALASIAILTFGDPVANLTRRAFTKKQPKRGKHLVGNIFGFVISFIAAMIFIAPLYAFVASFIGMAAELIYIKLGQSQTDDNLIIPLAAGTAVFIVKHFI